MKFILNVSSLILLFLLFNVASSQAQSNPKIDRPIQQCINKQADEMQVLKNDFSIGHWLGRLTASCEHLQASSGKGGGKHVIAILEMESALDDLIALSETCPKLSNEKIKGLLLQMKEIYKEKKEVESYDTDPGSGGLFEDEAEVTTYSLPRASAGKLKKNAGKIRKILQK